MSDFRAYSRAVGDSGESKFLSAVQSLDFKVRKASRHEDMRKHIDFHLEVFGVEMTVDVKGAKRGASGGRLCIELKNVNGNKGWLYGEADLIAFEVGDEFHLVDRLDLVDIIENCVDLDRANKAPKHLADAPRWYARHDRPDEAVTFVSLSRISKAIINTIPVK